MAHMTQRHCKNCRQPFMARTADVKRGWAKFCSKHCKAVEQTQRTGYRGPDPDGDGTHRNAHLEPWDDHKSYG